MSAVIFDMDGVIADTEPLHAKADAVVLERMGVNVDDQELMRFAGISSSVVFRQYLGEEISIEPLIEEKYQILLGMGDDIHPIPGVRELIEALRNEGWQIGLGSASRSVFIQMVLESLLLSTSFDVVASSQQVARGKPFPDIFLHCARQMRILPNQCIVIEDATAGIQAAKAAGMKTVGYRGVSSVGQDLQEADTCVSHFSQLNPSILKKLLERN